MTGQPATDLDPATKVVPLTRGKVALVDASDFERVAQYRWHYHVDKNGYAYAVRNAKVDGKWTSVRMHRFLMDAPPGLLVDHVDGNGLNNRRSNLRLATHSQNHQNIRRPSRSNTGHRGVSWCRFNQRYRAYVNVAGRMTTVGYFTDLSAAVAAVEAARRLRMTHAPECARVVA